MTQEETNRKQKKYEITDHAHPLYPWLHQICALVPVNEQVAAGSLGEYVQSEDNLSQEGSCWIYDRAVCCEEAVVSGEAGIYGDVMVRGRAVVAGFARMSEWACADGSCHICNGEIRGHARVAGEAEIDADISRCVPLIEGNGRVYGDVSGYFIIRDVVLPGEAYQNPTPDLFILENGKRSVQIKKREPEPPEQSGRPEEKKKHREAGEMQTAQEGTYEKQKKYEITDIAHPKYPWLHRIRALVPVNEQIDAGTLGGYVQSEDNLSQEGSCWIYDRAVCCEEAVVSGKARIYDDTMVRGSALVTGTARMFERACAEGNCCIKKGQLSGHARAAGDAVISASTEGYSPLIDGSSMVYGTVSGRFIVKDTVLPGEIYRNPTQDLIILENGQRDVLVKERKLEPPGKDKKPEKAPKRELER